MQPYRLRALERRLLDLLKRLPDPSPPRPGAGQGVLFGHRAESLYRGFLHSVSGPSQPTMMVALRALVELSILLRWFALDPDVNGEIWKAHSEDADLRVIREVERHVGAPKPTRVTPEEAMQKLAAKQAIVDEARAAVGGRRGRVGPTVAQMVGEIERVEPEHGFGMRQAYDVGYRMLSPWIHSEAASFKSAMEEVSPGRYRFLGDKIGVPPVVLRAIGAGTVAYCLEVIGGLVDDLDVVAEAQAIRTEIVIADAEGSLPSGE